MKELLATLANYMEAINPGTGTRTPQVEDSETLHTMTKEKTPA